MNASVNYASPYAHSGGTVNKIMLQVCLALIPCTAFGFYLFGWPAIFLFAVTCVAAIITELFCLFCLRQPWLRVLDGSALLTGWLIAITLPPWAPWWIGVVGSFFAIAVGKHLYGGVGQNIFNPAMLARTALLITFPVQMTAWVIPVPWGSEMAPGFFDALSITFLSAATPDALTGPTSLGDLSTALTLDIAASEVIAETFNLWQSFIGHTAGSMGESSELLVLLGAVYLLWRRIISWEIPVALIATLAFFAVIFQQYDAARYGSVSFHLASGGLFLGAFFIATDPVTSPTSRLAKLIFGFGCGVVIFIVRTWGTFPEAVAFAVLFMNAFTPLIDRYCKPRVYGRAPSGKPLPQLSSVELTQNLQSK